MSQVQAARFNDIIDLTEGDEGDDGQLGTLSDAAKKAEAAAYRLKSQLKSMTSASIFAQNDSFDRSAPSDTKYRRSTTHGLRNIPTEAMTPVARSTSNENVLRTPNLEPPTGTFGQPGPLHNQSSLASAHNNRSKLPEIVGDNDEIDISSVRPIYGMLNPSAAQKIPSVTSPDKLERTKMDQRTPNWTPKTLKSPSKHGIGKQDERDRTERSDHVLAKSGLEPSTLKAGSKRVALNGVGALPAPQIKRKRLSVSPQTKNPTKLSRKESFQSGHPSGTSASLDHVPPTSSSSEKANLMNGASHVQNGSTDVGKRDLGLQNTGLSDRNLQNGFRQNSLIPSFEDGPLFEIFKFVVYPALKKAKKRAKYSLSEDELMGIGKSVAIEVVDQKLMTYTSSIQAKPNKDQVEDLKHFVKKRFREKVQEAVTCLGVISTVSGNNPPEAQHQPLKSTHGSRFNAQNQSKLSTNTGIETLGQAVKASNMPITDSSQNALPSAPALVDPDMSAGRPPGKITDLSGYLRKLENETFAADLDEFQSTSPVRAQPSVPKANKQDHVIEPSSRKPSPPTPMGEADRITLASLGDQSDSLQADFAASVEIANETQIDTNSPSESSFPPDSDRGRYPALRRRRGNKHYTPVKKPSEVVMNNDREPSGPASQPSRMDSISMQASSVTGVLQVSEDEISQVLIARVAVDPKVKALLEVVASSMASQSELVEFQALTDDIKTHLESQKRDQSRDSRSHTVDMMRRLDNRKWPSISGNRERISSSSRPGIHKVSKDAYRQENGRFIQGIPRTKPQGSGTPDSGVSFDHDRVGSLASHSKDTLNPGFSTPHDQATADPKKPFVVHQKTLNHSRKRFRSEARTVVHSHVIETRAVTRSLATAFDPHLELLSAELLVNNPENTLRSKEYRRFIEYAEQEELLNNETLLQSASTIPVQHETQLPQAKTSGITRIETKVIDPARRPERHVSSLLRHREIGSDSWGRNIKINRELRLRRSEMIEPWRNWKGASGDVVAAAWGPDSTRYAVGAAAHTNPEDVQYNRPCNLLLGNLIDNTLTELPDHRVDRPKPETLANTYNARQAVYDACDPMVYKTVSSIAFSPTADRMYTASHDQTVKIWDTSATGPSCLMSLPHDSYVSSVEVSAQRPGLFATGSGVIENAVRIYYTENDDILHIALSSSRAVAKPAWKIHPECLRWGSTAFTSHLLLAGFHQNDRDEPSPEGQLCLWDANAFDFIKVVPSSQSVLAATWHPTLPFFATGGAPGGNLLTDKYKTKTVVRTWDLRSPKHYTMEYECSAFDMQDITFHPTDSHIVTAGCTDGTSFVWDYRRPDYPLHRLRHGKPLVDWDHTRGSREEVDTGVMMSLWGPGGSLFYTGSSDGMIKAWDIRRHPQDVMIHNVAQFGAGIQSGAFSPDGTNLLVGDADGGVHVLSSAPCGPQPVETGSNDVSPELPITLIRASSGSGLAPDTGHQSRCEGREAARDLTNSGQVILDSKLGVTQGPSHQTPYADYARREAVDPAVVHLHAGKSAESKQFFLRTREENEEVEGRRRGVIEARRQRIAQLYPEFKAAQNEALRESRRNFNNALMERSTSHPLDSGSVSDYPMLDTPPSEQLSTSKWDSILSPFRWTGGHGHSLPSQEKIEPPILESLDANVEHNAIPEGEMVEQNHWWPRLGEDEIDRARRLPRLRQRGP